MGLLSNESVSGPASGFADGIEFEETFPESAPASQPEPPRLTVVRAEPEPEPARAPVADRSEALYQEQLDRRLREAEAMVKQAIERLRLDEEKRLAEWVRQRRDEEERRLQEWVAERRGAIERTIEQRRSSEDTITTRIEELLSEWQVRFEQRLEQRRVDDERLAERRRISDEERLRTWRVQLEQELTDRFAERRPAVAAPERRADPLAQATSARDVGRILRELVSDIAKTAAFAVALHHGQRPEVAYRYRVAADDEVGALLRRETLDDGPDSAAAHMDGWVRAQRAVRVGGRNVVVHTEQVAVRVAGASIGVVTLQTEGEAPSDAQLARIAELVASAAPRLADLRAAGAYRGA